MRHCSLAAAALVMLLFAPVAGAGLVDPIAASVEIDLADGKPLAPARTGPADVSAGAWTFVGDSGRTGAPLDHEAGSDAAILKRLTVVDKGLVSPELHPLLQEIVPEQRALGSADVGEARPIAPVTAAGEPPPPNMVIPLPPAVVPGLILLALVSSPRLRKRLRRRHGIG